MSDAPSEHGPSTPPPWSRAAERTLRRCLRIIRLAAPIVPRERRASWHAEWRAELWHRIAALDRCGMLDAPARRDVVLQTLGALPHALWLRRANWSLDMLMHDLKYAARVNGKRPAFSLLVIAILGIGIGANSAMFSIVNTVLLEPLPYAHAERLVHAYGASHVGVTGGISNADFLDYQARNTVFSSLAAYTFFGTAILSGTTEPERVTAPLVTANFFSTLGLRPVLGRTFLPSEEDGQHHVAILSYGLWQRRFAGDPRIIGTTITVDGSPSTVVGIMPAMLEHTFDGQLWLPLPAHQPEVAANRGERSLFAIGRLRAGTTLQQARADLGIIARQLAATYPEDQGRYLNLVPYRDVVVGDAAPVLVLLLGAVALVLLIACGNVASLMLTRGTARGSEIAVRSALGASRSALIRQFLAESLMLGTAAGGAGLLLALLLVRAVRAMGGGLLPRAGEVHIDGTALLFTVAITLITTVLCGLAPALHAARKDMASAMRALGRASNTRRTVRLRDALVVGQVALSLVLLIGAGLLLQSLSHVEHVNPGFDPAHVLTAQIPLPGNAYHSRTEAARFWTSLLERVRALPGVTSAAGTGLLPLRGLGDSYYYVEGHPPASDADKRLAEVAVVTDDYFRTMRIPLLTGRPISTSDRMSTGERDAGNGAAHQRGEPGDVQQGVVVISKRMADKLFPNESPLGKRLVVHSFLAEIVGVAGDVHVFGQAVDAPDVMYFSLQQMASYLPMSLVVRTQGDPTSLAPSLRAILHQLDATVPLARVATMEQLLGNSRARPAFRTHLLGSFALVALLLAVVGLYGVLAHTVTQRTREIGVRIALGARASEIFRLIIIRGMGLVGLGVLIGVAGALAATRVIAGMLFNVGSTDPLVFAAVTGLLLLAGLAACVVPARHAMRISPVVALKEE